MENSVKENLHAKHTTHTNISRQAAPEFKTPFEHIALAFSGGGFRAAAYGLGVMSYLEQVVFKDHTNQDKETPLLKKVTYLSSASGGTITTALYSLYDVRGKSFAEYYKKLSDALIADGLLKEVSNLMNNNSLWTSSTKNRNIINSFATAYDKYLFEGAKVGELKPTGKEAPKTHLEEVCFNTTEFFRGLLFKQQVKLKADDPDTWFQYGSSFVYLKPGAEDKLRLGDVLAASSCFPAGFEPIIFPDDFADNKAGAEILKSELIIKPQSDDHDERALLKSIPEIGMMDGGITDNLGLESMMSADERRRRAGSVFQPFDLMLVNDVGSNFMAPYKPPVIKSSWLSNLFNITTFSAGLAVVLLAWVWSLHVIQNIATDGLRGAWNNCHSCCLYSLLGVTSALLLLLIFTGQNMLSIAIKRKFSQPVLKSLSGYVNKVSFYVFYVMLKARAKSVVTMTTDVFLKRVRQLLYNQFYGSLVWENRGKGNHIYDLSFSNDIQRNEPEGTTSAGNNVIKGPELTPEIQIVAETAFGMGTTLWFEKADEDEFHRSGCVVACGQFTTCYNMLEYIARLQTSEVYRLLEPDYKNRVKAIKQKLEKDFAQFSKDPFFLYNQFGAQCGVADFKPLKWQDIPFPKNFKGIKPEPGKG